MGKNLEQLKALIENEAPDELRVEPTTFGSFNLLFNFAGDIKSIITDLSFHDTKIAIIATAKVNAIYKSKMLLSLLSKD